VFPGGGDFHLAATSPLIDAGTPGGLFVGEPTTDLDGGPRLLAGNGTCAVRRDIGAYEFSPASLPPATAFAHSLTAAPGQPVTFEARACGPNPSAQLTYAWTFDDGGTATGITASHAFATPGAHSATVTISDADGRKGSARASLAVIPTPGPSAPVISKLLISKFGAGGATITYSDSQAGTTTFTITERVSGIRRGKRCVPAPRHPRRHAKRCTLTITLGSFTHLDTVGANTVLFSGRLGGHRLKPGHYLLTVVAIAPGEPAGSAIAVGFVVPR
jgi:hypothetical protein